MSLTRVQLLVETARATPFVVDHPSRRWCNRPVPKEVPPIWELISLAGWHTDTVQCAVFYVRLPQPIGFPDGSVHLLRFVETYDEFLQRIRAEDDAGIEDHAPYPMVQESVACRFWQLTLEPDTEEIEQVVLLARGLNSMETRREEATRSATMRRHRTVVEIASTLNSAESREAGLSEAFDRGLTATRDVQRAHYLTHHLPTPLITRELCPSIIPCVDFALKPAGVDSSLNVSLFILHANDAKHDAEPTPLAAEEYQSVDEVTQLVREARVFTRYVDFVREAQVARDLHGNYRSSILALATSAEVLLDDLLLHLLWEEAAHPESAATLFLGNYSTLASRVRTHFAGRLGGNWDRGRNRALRNWLESVQLLRSKIIHAGEEPDFERAQRSDHAIRELEEFVHERLLRPETVARFPRTALAMFGESGLERRGLLTRRVRRLLHSDDEPIWSETFGRWRTTVWRIRDHAATGIPRTPDPSRARFLCTRWPGEPDSYCLHDSAVGLALSVDSATAHLLTSDVSLPSLAEAQPPPRGMSIALFGVPQPSVHGEWVEEYRLVPEAHVMVDGSDRE